MSAATNTVLPTVSRKPRLLWANAYCLLDTTSGAAMDARQMLCQLVANGYEVEIVGATVFDNERGTLRLKPNWDAVKSCMGGLVNINDEPLQHRLVVTASTQRAQMTSEEEGLWFNLYQAVLDAFKPDVVFYYGGQVLDMLIPAEARARGIPAVAHLANGSFKGKIWCRDVALILTNSQATADMYARTQGYQAVPVGVFVDPLHVVAAQHTRERVLFINPSLEKGVGIVIQLALQLEKRRPDIVFEIVESRGSWQEMTEQIIPALGSSCTTLSNVVITPNTTDMRPLFGRARLLLAPSLWWEGAGRVLVEAMLNGIPAIVSDRGGMPEMIQDGGIKVIFPAKCNELPYTALPKLALLEPLLETIIKFYDDAKFYDGYVTRAYRVGQSAHGLDISTRRLLDALHPLVDQRAGNLDLTAELQQVHRLLPSPTAVELSLPEMHSTSPKISIIFPVGNREAFLREALESVLTQTFADFEVLIILDGVSAAVESIIDSYSDTRIRVIKFPINLGISAARNAGMRLARAPYIALMDSDDVALPERLSRQFAWMQSHPEITVCASNAIKLFVDGRRVPMRYPETDGMIKSRLLIVDSALLNPTTMFRSDFIRQHALEYDSNFLRDHDHRLFVEMMRKGARFHGLQEDLLLYRRHNGNVTADRTGVDEEKNRVREIVLPLFFPALTGNACRLLLKGMGEQVNMTVNEAREFVTVIERALQERRVFVGEDRDEIRRILDNYQQRIVQSLNQASVVSEVETP